MKKFSPIALLLAQATAFISAPATGTPLVFGKQDSDATTLRVELADKQQLVLTVSGETGDLALTGLNIDVQKGKTPSKAISAVTKLLTGKGLGYGQATQKTLGSDTMIDIPVSKLMLIAPPLGQIINTLTDRAEVQITPDTDLIGHVGHIFDAVRAEKGIVPVVAETHVDA